MNLKGISTITVKILTGLSVMSIGALLLTFQQTPTSVSSIQEILSSPESFRGELVQLNGFLIKSVSNLETVHFLIDDTGRIALKSLGPDLDFFVGLRVSIIGNVNFATDMFDSSGTIIIVTNASLIEGSPNFFLQLERIGGIAGLHDTFFVDNNYTANMYMAGNLVWRAKLNRQQIEKLKRLILDNNFLDQEVKILPKNGVADYFTYRLKIIIQTQEGLVSHEVSWIDEWASSIELPSFIINLQRELQTFIREIAKSLQENLEFEISIDKTEVVSGEKVKVKIRLSNVGQEKVTFETGLPMFDLILYDWYWRPISRWSDGKTFIMIILKIELSPGQSLEERVEWDLSSYNKQTGNYSQCISGLYFISALFRARNTETVSIPIRVI